MKKIFLFLLAVIGLTAVSSAKQNDTVPEQHVYVGAFAHLNFNFHSADFSALPGLFSCCPKYESGNGIGTAFGILADIPLKPKLFLGIRFGYSALSGKLTRDEIIGNTYSGGITTGDPTTKVSVEHSIDAKISGIALEPQLIYYFYDRFSGELGLKGTLLTTKNFTQKEEIKSPNNVVFSDNGMRERNIYSDEKIPDAHTFIPALTLGAAYSFALSNGLLISPELRFEVPFVDLSSVSWKVSTLAGGLTVKYPLVPKANIPEIDSVIYRRDTLMIATSKPGDYSPKLLEKMTNTKTIKQEDYTLNIITHEEHYSREYYKPEPFDASLSIVGINAGGEVVEVPQLLIEEVEATETFPLLPYIFFDNAASDLTSTRLNLISNNESRDFAENHLNNWNALAIYKNLLNIIGSRLRDNPNATITLVGCNSNTGVEENNTDLSRRRAESVKKYLQDVWSIDSKRMTIQTRNLPLNFANIKNEVGAEENRRVEISSNDRKIVESVTLREIHKTANPPIVRIMTQVTMTSPITSWKLDITQNNSTLRSFSGNNSYPDTVDWTVETLPVPLEETPVSAKMTLKNDIGQTAEVEKKITIEQKTIREKKIEKEGNVRIDRFSLILFDYDKSEVNEAQNAQIKEIKSAIKSNSLVTVTGYTDIKTGDKAYNKQLAMQRAQNVANKLGISAGRVKVVSAGGEIGLYDNKLPEGRNLSRTVKVVVETPED